MSIVLNEATQDDGVAAALSALVEAASASPEGYTPEDLRGMLDAVVLGEGLMDKLKGAAHAAANKASAHLAARAAEKRGDHLHALMLRNPEFRKDMERQEAEANTPEAKRARVERILKSTAPHHGSTGMIHVDGTTFHTKDGVITHTTED